MCHDITADGLLLIARIRTCSSIRVGHDLVRDDDCDAELIGILVSFNMALSGKRRVCRLHRQDVAVFSGTCPGDFDEMTTPLDH